MIRQLIGPVLLVASLANCAATSVADDWPQWRGPTRDGVWRETGIIEEFPEDQLEIRWRADLASGYSGPTVADERVFVTDRQVKPEQIERIHCFDARSGIKIWTYSYDCPYRDVGYEAGPRASVTIDDGRAYSLGTMGHLFCLDAGTGLVLWEKDLNSEYGIRMPIWGIAAAPLVVDRVVILHIGGSDGACVVALDKKDGDEQWRALDDQASYTAPILIDQAGHSVVVCWTGDHVAGLDPGTGEVFWQHPFPPNKMVIGIATPVVDRDRLFVTSFYDGSMMLRLDQNRLAVEQLWKRVGSSEQETDALQSIISTPLILGDHIYGVDSYGELRCLEVESGDRVWEDRTATPPARWSNIHTVMNGDRAWMFNERGDLVIANLSSQGFHEISRAHLIDPTTDQLRRRGGVCWAHPAYADRHVFARNDRELVCASLEAN